MPNQQKEQSKQNSGETKPSQLDVLLELAEQSPLRKKPQEEEEKVDTRIEGSVYEGFVGALFSVIMGVVALIIMLGISMNVVAEILCLYGLILGVRGIRDYKGAQAYQKAKPTPALVLGIIGVIINAVALVIWLIWIVGYFLLMMKKSS